MLTRRVSKQSQLLLLFFYLPLYFISGSIIGSAIVKLLITEFSLKVDSQTATLLLNLIVQGSYVIVGVLIFKDSLKKQIIDFKNNLPILLKYGLLIGPALLMAGNLLGNLVTVLLQANDLSQNQEAVELLTQSFPFLMVIVTVIFAPIVEEILFRGLIFGTLYPYNRIFAHIVSGFIFGFIHIMGAIMNGQVSEWFLIFPYMFMGWILSYLYEKCDNIIVPILSHGMMNLIATLLI